MQIVRGINEFADNEALRVMELLIDDANKWYIEEEKFMPSHHYLNIPISFKLI